MKILLTAILIFEIVNAFGQKADTLKIFFAKNQFILSSADKTNLKKFSSDKGSFVIVRGFADKTGSTKYNLTLSKKRAQSVYEYLKENGVSAYQISYGYFGKEEPVFLDRSETYQSQNRRVDIIKYFRSEPGENKKDQPSNPQKQPTETSPKNAYDIFKDIIIPVLSFIVTALALILVIKLERAKNKLQAEDSLRSGVNAVLRDLIYFSNAYHLFSICITKNIPVTNLRIKQLKSLYAKLHKSLTENPDIFHQYIRDIKADNSNTLTLLLVDMQLTVNSLTTKSRANNILTFGIFQLFYLFETDDKMIKENKQNRETVINTNPSDYDNLIVNRKDGK